MLLLVTLLACADSDSVDTGADPCAPGPAPELTLGTGEAAYAPMPADGVLELIHGPQGGFHVLIGLEGRFIDSSQRLEVTLEGLIDGEAIGRSVPLVDFRCDAQRGVQQAWNFFLVFDAAPEALDGQACEVQASFTDASGTPISAEAQILIDDPAI